MDISVLHEDGASKLIWFYNLLDGFVKRTIENSRRSYAMAISPVKLVERGPGLPYGEDQGEVPDLTFCPRQETTLTRDKSRSSRIRDKYTVPFDTETGTRSLR